MPPAAIREFNGRRFVVIEQDGLQQRVDVFLGANSGERVEIRDGLAEGQVIIGQ